MARHTDGTQNEMRRATNVDRTLCAVREDKLINLDAHNAAPESERLCYNEPYRVLQLILTPDADIEHPNV